LVFNQIGNRNHWLGIVPYDGERKRVAVGARVSFVREAGKTFWRRSHADSSYVSSSDPRILFGLGSDPKPGRLTVYWVDGKVESWSELSVDQYHLLKKGTGTKVQ